MGARRLAAADFAIAMVVVAAISLPRALLNLFADGDLGRFLMVLGFAAVFGVVGAVIAARGGVTPREYWSYLRRPPR